MAVLNSVGNSLTGSTGTGNFVGANTPTLITPVIGAATGTSLNLGSSTTITGMIDDDSMATASASLASSSESIKAYVDAQVGSSGGLQSVQVFTAGGTWTKPAGINLVRVIVVGGGGGSGGGVNNGAGGGGGGGGCAIETIDVTGTASETVTVGAAGSAGAAGGSGGTGGTSSFGAYCSATGGSGGITAGSAANGGAGGVGSGGDINLSGQGGGAGGDASSSIPSGAGGGSYLGGGGIGIRASAAGNAGGNYGGGAGGAKGVSNAGAAGAGGIVAVYEYS